jgi:hypothetical protein
MCSATANERPRKQRHLGGPLVVTPLRSAAYLVVPSSRLDSAKQSTSLGFEDRHLVFVTSEGPDGIQRREEVEDRELDLVVELASQDEPALVAVNGSEARKYGIAKQTLVAVSVLEARPSLPQASDH